MTVPAFIDARRSIRAFADKSVDPDLIDHCIEAACCAPAPHHSRPWRWVTLTTDGPKLDLASAMGERWRTDLTGDGVRADRIDTLVQASIERLTASPALVLACLTDDGLDHYPDVERQRAEFGMALLSLGAAVENLMLTATDVGLASCWVAAPIFCPDEARSALALDAGWIPQALICLGYPEPGSTARPRPEIPLEELRRRL